MDAGGDAVDSCGDCFFGGDYIVYGDHAAAAIGQD